MTESAEKTLSFSLPTAGNDVKRKIYECAMHLFMEKGFDNVKVSDICAETGVAIGTFYYHFKSKEAILMTFTNLIEESITEYSKSLRYNSPEDQIRKLFLYKWEALISYDPALNKVGMVANINSSNDVGFNMDQPLFRLFRQALMAGVQSGIFRSDLDIETAVSMLRYIIAGLCLHWSICADHVDRDKEVNRELDLFFSLIRS